MYSNEQQQAENQVCSSFRVTAPFFLCVRQPNGGLGPDTARGGARCMSVP